MQSKFAFAVLAAALVAAPLSAQIRPRTDPVRRLPDGTVIRSDGSVVRTSDGTVVRTRTSHKIPPGQLPPKGMCRVWIDGVPPGQQPPVTDCATAERNRVANSHVIYGDRTSFPGQGKGRNRDGQTNCTFRDAVVVGDRVVNVCRDANGNVMDHRSGRDARRDDHDDDDDHFEHSDRSGKSGKFKSDKKGKKDKHGDRDD